MNIYRLCVIENTHFSNILNYSDTAEFYQCPQTHLQCSPNGEFHTPNSPFVPPTVIRGKYIAVMWMYSVIILILHGSYTKSLELWNDNLMIKFDFLIGTDICSSIGPFWKPLSVCHFAFYRYPVLVSFPGGWMSNEYFVYAICIYFLNETSACATFAIHKQKSRLSLHYFQIVIHSVYFRRIISKEKWQM
jgi:hypothetical protein